MSPLRSPILRRRARFRRQPVRNRVGAMRSVPLARRAQPRLSRFQIGFRAVVFLAAWLPLLGTLVGGHWTASDGGLILTATVLLLLVRLNPIARAREHPLTFVSPVVFALTLWTNATVAASSALFAFFLYARFGQGVGSSRREARFIGAQLAFSALMAGLLYRTLGHLLGTDHLVSQNMALAHLSGAMAVRILVAATLAACTFLGMQGFVAIGTEIGHLRTLWRKIETRTHVREAILVYLSGILPVVLLAPLGANIGLTVVLPCGALLLAVAQMTRLNLEVVNLRGQLRTAEAMGRASVTETDEVDAHILLQRFLTLAQGLVSSDRSLVWVMDQDTGVLTPLAGLPDTGLFGNERAVYGEGLIGHTATRFSPRLIANAARDAHRGRREIASGAWLLYPIIVHERLLGVAQWIRPTTRPFTQEDVTRLDALVPQAAIALENVRIRRAMQHLAATDGLTNLWNHRRMHELLAEEMRRASRYHRALSVLMLDVDSFKTFNDSYGHPAGDELLRQIATILRANVRNVDCVGRYGGEEFIVLLPETSKDDACRMAERIRSAVEAQAVVMIDDRPIRRTVSVGVASYPEDALNPSELVMRADEALYRAKRAGKNCVIWA